ncbi:hypothetical protein V6N12_055734 [Hibiscus sabdariffa]|uniref:Uncharacterized protein n=1 Tax=Hibiscus sabdariffa TaxID=183260 RepID=A0ABR1ZJ95_9ROSI
MLCNRFRKLVQVISLSPEDVPYKVAPDHENIVSPLRLSLSSFLDKALSTNSVLLFMICGIDVSVLTSLPLPMEDMGIRNLCYLASVYATWVCSSFHMMCFDMDTSITVKKPNPNNTSEDQLVSPNRK